MCSAFRWEYPLTIVACALNTGIRHATTLRIHRPFCGIRDVRQCTYNAILRRVRATIVAVEKAGNVFVALVSSMATARAILSSVTCPALQFFSTSPHKRNDFRKDVIERKIRFLNFSTKFDRNISHSKKNWGRYGQKCISSQKNTARKIIIVSHHTTTVTLSNGVPWINLYLPRFNNPLCSYTADRLVPVVNPNAEDGPMTCAFKITQDLLPDHTLNLLSTYCHTLLTPLFVLEQ